MRTRGRHRRFHVTKTDRRLLAAAGIASLAVVGAASGASPAVASYPPISAPTAVRVPVAETPLVALTSNYTTVTAKHAITFTATEKHPDGTPVASQRATLQVSTKTGWQNVTTKTLSSAGAATFSFKPNYDHQYRAVFPAATVPAATVPAATVPAAAVPAATVPAAATPVAGGVTTTLQPVTTANVTVKAKPADIGPEIVAAAAKEKGKPYVFDTDGPNTFDCSGLVKYVFAKFGINLPHHADDMKHYGVEVSEKDAKPGDLVFVFSGSYAHHVAIYAGNGYWWEAPHTGASVRLVKIWSTDIEFRRVR